MMCLRKEEIQNGQSIFDAVLGSITAPNSAICQLPAFKIYRKEKTFCMFRLR
jgi:hypothetical protein